MVCAVVEEMREPYKELEEQKDLILSVVTEEERRFLKTLDQGSYLLEQAFKKLPQSGSRESRTLSGDVAFQLYDTYGFPFDLTCLIAQERGVCVDEVGFQKHMQKAREKAKISWKVKSIPRTQAHLVALSQKALQEHGPTQFVGYTQTDHSSQVILLSNGAKVVDAISCKTHGLVVLGSSSFYAEGGGQVGDTGNLFFPGGQAKVVDCTQQSEVFFHHIEVCKGELKTGTTVQLQVEASQRQAIARNHSATHLMNAALRKILGKHVTQAGSLVDENRLRFDFTHPHSLSTKQIRAIEDVVNGEISRSIDVHTKAMPLKQAKSSGALCLPGEKYSDKVRVVQMGKLSMEFCGGTHVSNTSSICVFKIVSEGSVSAGVRRVEALTGDRAVDYLLKHTEQNLEVRQYLGVHEKLDGNNNALMDWVKKSQNKVKILQKQVKQLKSQVINLKEIRPYDFVCHGAHGKLILADLDVEDHQALRDISDRLCHKWDQGVMVVIGKGEKFHPVVVQVSANLTKFFHAGNLLKEIVALMDGKGGGRADVAQGVAKNRDSLKVAFDQIKKKFLK